MSVCLIMHQQQVLCVTDMAECVDVFLQCLSVCSNVCNHY